MDLTGSMHKNTYKLLFESYNKHTGEYSSNENVIADISIFTTKYDRFKDNLIKDMIYLKSIRYSYELGMYFYVIDKNNSVYFNLISDTVNFLNEDDKLELVSDRRKKRCYIKSIYLASSFRNSMVLFGTAKVGDYQYLHAVVQFNFNGKLLIADWNHNIIMPKDEYFKLFNYQVINRVFGTNIISDYNLCSDIYGQIPLSVYLGFNQELVNNAKRLLHEKKTVK